MSDMALETVLVEGDVCSLGQVRRTDLDGKE